MTFIGDLIDKLTVVNIKIWDATEKGHLAHAKKDFDLSKKLFENVESMNLQRRELINEINNFFHQQQDVLNSKSYGSSAQKNKQTNS